MSTRSKFSLKPSSLSQHTVNFNKILEEVPSPKIDSIILEKPKLSHVLDTKTDIAMTDKNIIKKNEPNGDKEEPQTTGAQGFVFGEQLTDRVVNALTTEVEEKNNGQTMNGNGNKDGSELGLIAEAKPIPVFGNQEVETEKSHIENTENDANSLIRMKCKLFVLDKDSKDQASWSERGYGTLKMIDANDGINCKIMMWTDKCFRLVLNTKLFESMDIEKVNRKSIRLNAQDEGTIKIFLIKCGHPNECEELSMKMIARLKTYRDALALIKTDVSPQSQIEVKADKKEILFEFECYSKPVSKNENDSTEAKKVKINIYTNTSQSSESQLLFNVLDITNQTYILTDRYIKSIKLDEKSKSSDYLEFEAKESFNVSHKVIIKNSESIESFLKYFEQENSRVVSTDLDLCSNDSLNNETTSGDEAESDSPSYKKSDKSVSLESSVTETNKSEADIDSQNGNENGNKEDAPENSGVTKKRKSDEDIENVENTHVKKITLDDCKSQNDEDNSVSLKRTADSSSQESNQDDKATKKSKVTEDDVF